MEWSAVWDGTVSALAAVAVMLGVVGAAAALRKGQRLRSRLKADTEILNALPDDSPDAEKMREIVSRDVAALHALVFPDRRDVPRRWVARSIWLDLVAGTALAALGVMRLGGDRLRPDGLTNAALELMMLACLLLLSSTQFVQMRAVPRRRSS